MVCSPSPSFLLSLLLSSHTVCINLTIMLSLISPVYKVEILAFLFELSLTECCGFDFFLGKITALGFGLCCFALLFSRV